MSSQTLQAYCSDSSGTVHLATFPSCEEEKKAAEAEASSLELNESQRSPETTLNGDEKDEKHNDYDVEKGRM